MSRKNRLLEPARFNQRRLLHRIATLILAACVAQLAFYQQREVISAEKNSVPNIVLILADDLGWTDLGCFGSSYYETPNIDKLAAGGMKFTDAYSCGPNCAPTRACLMSGQYTPRHGIYTVGTGARGKEEFRKLIPVPNEQELSSDVTTLAEVLQSQGYVTGHFGKWHLGSPPKLGPEQQGFDLNVAGDLRGHPATYFSPYKNAQLKDGPKGEYLTDRLTDEVLDFIREHQKERFFVYLPHYAVHTPIQGKAELTKKYKEKKSTTPGHDNPQYAAMIESVDEGVGRILDLLDELKLSDNTLVIFTSDNGGLGGYNALGLKTNDVTSQRPLKGGKGMLYEGGIRVPLIVRYPGVTKAGSVCETPVLTVDYFPTLVKIAGADAQSKVGKKQPLDGEDISQLFADASSSLDRAIYWHFPGYLQANQGAGTWRTTPGSVIRHGNWKLIEFFEEERLELYDLSADIGETKNLAQDQPEIASRMHAQLKAWRKEIGAPLPERKQ